MTRGLTMDGRGMVVNSRGVAVGSAIPDSAVLHWPHDEGSGSTLAETVGTYGDQDGSITGGTWTADANWWDGQYLDYDGNDDETTTGQWGSFGSGVMGSAVTFILEAAWPSGDDGYTIGMGGDGNQLLGIGVRSFITQDQQGQIGLYWRNEGQEAGTDNPAFATDATFDDGNRHFVALQMQNSDPSTGQIYIDTGYVTTNDNSSGGDPSGEDFSGTVYFGRTGGGAFSSVGLGRVMVCDAILSESELDDLATQHGFNP